MMAAAGAAGGGIVGYALWGWGQGESGILGNGAAQYYNCDPIQIGSETYWLGRDPEDIRKVKLAVAYSTGTITNEGKLYTWGSNEEGRLGNGDTTKTCSPGQVGSLEDWGNIAGCGEAYVSVKTDGTLWAWGYGRDGTLGQGEDTSSVCSPIQIGSLTDWDRVYGSGNSCLSIKTDGTLWAWGRNATGQLGTGDIEHPNNKYTSPVQIGSLTNWDSISVGGQNTAAVKTDGTLWGWGQGENGDLGKGNTTDYSSPVQIGSLTDWSQTATPYGSTTIGGGMAVKTDGTLWGWGTNGQGQIGVGNTTTYSSPVQIGSLTDWKLVVVNQQASYAIKTDGTVWFWGSGLHGTGAGDTTDYSSPVQIGTDTSWQQIGSSGSGQRTCFAMKN